MFITRKQKIIIKKNIKDNVMKNYGIEVGESLLNKILHDKERLKACRELNWC